MLFPVPNDNISLEHNLRFIIDYMNNTDPGSMCNILNSRFESSDFERGEYTCSFETKYEFRNLKMMLHGGIIAAMLDTAMGCLTIAYQGVMTPTGTMETSYLRQIPLQDRLYIKSRLVKNGRTTCNVIAEAWMGSNPKKLVASAAASYHVSNDN